MKRRHYLTILCLVALFAVSTMTMNAQVLYGSIIGTVEDPTGAIVPKAKVILTNKATGAARETEGDEAGRYSLLSVQAGSYDLKVTAPGFRTSTRSDVEVTINSVTRVDVKLEVGQMTEQVTVSAAAAVLQTDKSEVRTEIASQTITSMPLPGYRNYQSLINLVPGATPAGFQNAVVDTPGRALTTNSGTNDLHGVGYWFHNNNRFNTAPYFRSATFKLPKTTLNIAGGTIGGPIKKDKLFYFFSYERTMEGTGYTGNYSVAPADFRAGDFSRWTSYAKVYDPATAPANNAAARTPFPNNIVPQSRWNSIFPNIYKNMPLPNQTSPTDPNNLSGNYFASGVLSLTRNQYDFKSNYSVNSKLAVWGKYSRMDAPVKGVYPFGELGGSALGTEGFGDTTTQLVTAGYNYTFSPTFLMDGVFGYTRMDQVVGIPGVDKNLGLDVWKIPGTNGGKQYANDPRYGGAPHIGGFGFSDIGITATWAPVWRAERSYTFQANFSKIMGAHEIRFGFEPRKLSLTHWQPETANPRGYIGFGAGSTNVPSQVAREVNSYAAALLGLVNNYSKSIQFFEMKNREWQNAFYVRDRWQVNRRLTLNLGLRYEYYPLINRDDRGIERWDPFTNIVYFGGLGSTPRNAGIEVSKKLFAPRVGFAYRMGDNYVVRAGYGITYDPIPFSRPLRGLYPATLTGSWVPTVTTYGWYNNVDQGIPDIVTPDVSKGQAVLPVNLDMGPRSAWGGMLHRGYIQSWNFTVERRLPSDATISAGYVATRTIHQLLDRNINTVGPGLGTTTANLPLAKAYGKTIGASMWDGIGYGAYDSLQVHLNKSFSHGLMAKVSYTWSKSLNFADDDGWAGMKAFNWEPMLSRNYSPAGYDRRHMFTAAWVYALPFGKGQKFGLSGIADMIAGGWRLNGMFSAYSGTPFTVSGSGSSLQCIGCTQTADQIGPVKKLDGKGPQQPFYDPSAFRDPLYYFNQTGVYRPGSMGINRLYGPGFWRLDPGLFKNFKITEKVNMEFRAESTNVAHNARWGNPSGSSANMRLNPDGSLNTSVANPLNGFMTITSADSTRQFRFGLRLAF
ncbi:MAG: TonB-dependent receptor [Acidobacteria bacterium]|nr:TonB-dependent receptor [Acidobacteriota bacterium]